MMRSKYAAPNTKTYAELLFEYRGKEYRVKRNPEYTRQSLRQSKSGMTTEKADAELIYPDGSTVSGSSAVTKAVTALIGLDREQYIQVAMLSQGEFLKLLFASTQERSTVFRSIFRTENYLILQKRIKDDLDAADRECSDCEKGIDQYISGLSCKPDSSYEQILSDIRSEPRLFRTEEICEAIKKITEEDKAAKSETEKSLEKIDKAIEETGVRLGKAELRNKAAAQLAETEQLLKKRLEDLPPYEEKFKSAKAEYESCDDISAEISREKERLADYAELKKTGAERDARQKLSERLNAETAAAKKHSASLSDTLAKYRSEAESLGSAGENRQKLENTKSMLNDRAAALSRLMTDMRSLASMKGSLSEAQQSYVNAVQYSEQAQTRYAELEKLFLDEQAGVLAAALKQGEKCPVCGSTDHPSPAVMHKNAPSEQELKKAKLTAESAQTKAADLSRIAGEIKGRYEALNEAIKESSEKILGKLPAKQIVPALKEAADKTAAEIKLTDENIAAEARRAKRKAELEKAIPAAEEELRRNDSAIAENEKLCAAADAEIKALSASIEKITSALKFSSEEEAAANINALEKKKKSIQDNYTASQAALDSCKKAVHELTSSAETLKEQLKASENIDLEEINEQRQQLFNEKKTLTAENLETSSRLAANTSALKGIAARSEKLAKSEERYKWIKALYDTAGGTISGKEKITLETYIQTAYFKKTVDRANLRFMVMTDGQYELKRSTDDSNRQSKTGLELDVIDHYNGSVRSVKTLSGGEAFMASLSLALGLSDEIQSSAGGIQLDTMFVDEGFGSLDGEALNQAVNALCRLSQNGRSVGIISHVSELKDRIDRQIIVTKDKKAGCSHVKVVC